MVYTYDYDLEYPGPAFPTVDLIIFNFVDVTRSQNCTAWVDSGTDATMIPLEFLQSIGARQVDQKRIYGIYWCEPSCRYL